MIVPTGFRGIIDARWQYPRQFNLPGITSLALVWAPRLQQRGIETAGHRGEAMTTATYSLSIKNALMLGLMPGRYSLLQGIALPIAHGRISRNSIWMRPRWAMVTPRHNPNGWTGR